jgi:hypothetical protein
MNMLKLLQEVRGFAQFTSRPNETRQAGPLLLQFRAPVRRSSARKRHLIKIWMEEPVDIPARVPIKFLPPNP